LGFVVWVDGNVFVGVEVVFVEWFVVVRVVIFECVELVVEVVDID